MTTMTWREIFALPRRHTVRHRLAVLAMLAAILIATLYPSDLPAYHAAPYDGADSALVGIVEQRLRHVNTIAALAVPLVLRDWTGLRQLAVLTLTGTLATQGPKFLLNDITVGGTRLGERPYGTQSRHNMPSGHSALAASVIWFLGRRYSWWWLLLTVPITALTVWARLMLNAHTFSAVIAGCLIGILITALFVTPRGRA